MSLALLLIIILIVLMVGAIPRYPYSASWGYYPSGAIFVVLVVLLVLYLAGAV